MQAIIEQTPEGHKKKFKVVVTTGERKATLRFGQRGYEDYTTHGDDDRKRLYLARHSVKENHDDPFKAGFWSRWLLWNRPTLEDSAEDIERRYEMKVSWK